ncbi:MAG TPA: CBS domain-containing protein [Planctomycetota bacterium]|nr:CBS domain-containing protein [Planctomycetota bacterium]
MKPWNERTAADVMNSPILSLDSETTLSDAAAYMCDNQISGAPILDHMEHPVGVVSLFDIVTYLSGMDVPGGGFYRYSYPKFAEGGDGWEKGWEEVEPDTLKNTPVSEIMSAEILTVGEEAPLPEVARLMKRKHIHRLFVGRNGRLVGVISTMDILGALSAPARRVAVHR